MEVTSASTGFTTLPAVTAEVPPVSPQLVPPPLSTISTRHSYSNSQPRPHHPAAAASPAPSAAPEPKRRSLTAAAATAATAATPTAPYHSPSNHLRGKEKERHKQHPATPEVMSNLIDSLSSISVPAASHAATQPVLNRAASATATYPPDPIIRPMRSFGGISDIADRSGDLKAFRESLRQELLNHLDDAAEPPVVRTSKRPSGYSEWTAPRARKESPNNIKAYLKSGATSRSATSLVSSGDEKTAANAILGPAAHRGPAHSQWGQRTGSFDNGVAGRRGQHTLYHTGSGEKLRNRDGDGKREPASLSAILTHEYRHSPRPSIQLPDSPQFKRPQQFRNFIDQPPPVPYPTTHHARKIERQNSRRRGNNSSIHEPIPSQPNLSQATGPSVPSRRSSLKVQDSPDVSNGTLSHQGSGQQLKSDTVPEVDEPPSRPQTQDVHESNNPKQAGAEDILAGEDNHVTRRIRELKARKEERVKLARKHPTEEQYNSSDYQVEFDSELASVDPTPRASEDWPVRPSNDTMLSVEKTRKFGGGTINMSPPRPHLDARAPIGLTNGDHPNLVEQPETPLTPTLLPINYQYVLKNLGQDSPPSTKAASSKDSVRTASSRPKSMAVGGRSAASRKKVTKSLQVGSPGRRQSEADESTMPPLPAMPVLPDFRSETSGASTAEKDRESLDGGSGGIAGMLTKRSNSKKGRWSHQDSPGYFDRKGSTRDTRFAVKPPERPDTVLEESRPASADSVGRDVDAFINAQRLSQKIRHAQTGRIISFSEVGDPNGHAVFCCVGMGLTRYVTAFYDELATTLKLRLITPDRPGVGESQTDPVGTPLSWPGKFGSASLFDFYFG